MRNTHAILFSLLAVTACGEVVPVGEGGGVDAGPSPTILSISPDHGPVAGGLEVTITGTGFETGDAGDAQVVVGGFLAPTTTVVDDGTVTFVTPAGLQEGEIVDITVFNQNGHVTLPAAFRYNEEPIVLSVSPSRGRAVGGTNVTITGRGFSNLEAGSPTVTIDGVAAANVIVVDDQTITATTAAAPASLAFEPLDVVVTNANGTDTLEDSFELTRQGLLAVERCCSNRVFYIDPSGPTVAEIGSTARKIHGCVKTPGGTLLAISRNNQTGRHDLVSFDPLSGTVTTIGALRDGSNVARNVTGLAFAGTTLVGWSRDDGRMVSINPSTAVISLLGAATITLGRPNAVATRDTTNVFVLDLANQTVDTVNTGTGALTAGPTITPATASSLHGAVSVGGALLVTEYGGTNRLLSINPTTGAMTSVTALPSIASGLCETPASF